MGLHSIAADNTLILIEAWAQQHSKQSQHDIITIVENAKFLEAPIGCWELEANESILDSRLLMIAYMAFNASSYLSGAVLPSLIKQHKTWHRMRCLF